MNRLYLVVGALVALVMAGAVTASADKLPPPPPGVTQAEWQKVFTPLPGHPVGIPADAVPHLGCIPTMGYHYAAPNAWPAGPIYGWYNGQVTFTEVMLPESSFKAGKEWSDVLKPLPGHKIDHVDFWYVPHGHPGYMEPHYDIHAWYIPASQYMYFCNPSGKRPAWLGGKM